MNNLGEHFKHGINFVRNNPQIIYTIFLLIAIPFAFLYTGQKFLDVSVENQERIERERLGLFQDTLSLLAKNDIRPLQENVIALSSQNPAIKELKILVVDGGTFTVLASLNSDDIGVIETEEKNIRLYRAVSFEPESSFIFQDFVGDERHWKAVRAITDERGEVTGVIYTDISLESIDAIARGNIIETYYMLFFVVTAIVILLFRQARIIDYATLYGRLKEVDKLKDDFIGMAAHELKTPLTVISGYISMLSSERLSDEDKKNISFVNISVKQLNSLISDILDVAKLTQGRLQFNLQEVDIALEAQKPIQMLQTLAEEKHLKLIYEKKDSILKSNLDPERLHQVLTNLIGNAIKYTPRGQVKVLVYEEKERAYIRISDTGLGISAEDQKHLFERFFRVMSEETQDIRGTGLGLWITREIVQSMKGKISIESIKGKGSDFIISFALIK